MAQKALAYKQETQSLDGCANSMNFYEFDSVICFGGEDWWYHNRGHIDMQLMRRFARLVTTVYINSIVMQKPNFAEGKKFIQKFNHKAKSIFTGLKKSDSGFWVYSPFSLPVHHIKWAKEYNETLLQAQMKWIRNRLCIRNPIVWVACPAACNLAVRMKKSKLVYQRSDRFEKFPGVDISIIKHFDRKLKANADLTIFVNNNLYQEESGQCQKAVYLDHGVDYEMFSAAVKSSDQPPDIIGIPRPIIGFYGGFAEHTTDIYLLEKVAELLPNKSFVFIGQASHECDSLKARKNVWMLGQKAYEKIPFYGQCFDVAIMPWRQNSWIEACNPVKLKEYLALGKPVVSTPFNELNKYLDVVYEAKNPESFAQAIEKALAENKAELISARRKKVQNATWDSKAQQLLKAIYAA